MGIADMQRSVNSVTHAIPIQTNISKTTVPSKTIEEKLQEFINIFLSALTAQSEETRQLQRFVQNTVQTQDAETQTNQTIDTQEPKSFSIFQEKNNEDKSFGAEPLDLSRQLPSTLHCEVHTLTMLNWTLL
jgi:hypothetical protein